MKRIFVWSRALCVCVVGWILCQTRCGSPHTTDVSFRVVVFVVPFSMECSTVDGQLTMVLVGLELWLVVVGSEVATVALSLSLVYVWQHTQTRCFPPFCCCFFSRPCRVVVDGHFFFSSSHPNTPFQPLEWYRCFGSLDGGAVVNRTHFFICCRHNNAAPPHNFSGNFERFWKARDKTHGHCIGWSVCFLQRSKKAAVSM